MTTMLRRTLLLLLFTAALPACAPRDPDTAPAGPGSSPEGPMAADSTFTAAGTVRRVNVEGGCWRFDLDDGRHFELKAADPSILVDGRRATLTLRPRPDLMSICQMGSIAEVVEGP